MWVKYFIIFKKCKFIRSFKHEQNDHSRLFADGWCLEAFTLAQGRMLEELTNVLIMLVVGKVSMSC